MLLIDYKGHYLAVESERPGPESCWSMRKAVWSHLTRPELDFLLLIPIPVFTSIWKEFPA